MNRRQFIELKGAALAATGLSTAGLRSSLRAETPATSPEVGTPVLLNPDSGKVSVVWRVHSLSTGAIEYGTTEDLGEVAVEVAHGLRHRDAIALRVHLQDLNPDTTYYYRTLTTPLNYEESRHKNIPTLKTPHRGKIYQFRTPSIRGNTASFAVINDTHENAPVIHALFEKLQADPADAIIWNGDLFNDIYSASKVTEQTLDLLGPKAYAAQTPIVFAYGNHDVRGEYALDLEKVIPTRDGRRYFTFQSGPIQFMVLDTGEDKPDSHAYLANMTRFEDYRSEQRVWIAREIERKEWRDAAFRVILCHIPLFGPSHCPDGQAKWHDLLVKGKADLMISGHTHRHAYHGPNEDRPYPLLVGGGPKAQQATLIRGRVEEGQLHLSMEMLEGKSLNTWTLRSRA